MNLEVNVEMNLGENCSWLRSWSPGLNFVLELFLGKSCWMSILGRFSQRFGWLAPTMNYFVLGLFLGKSWWRSILGRFSQRFGWLAPTMNQICSWAVRSQDLIKGWTWYSKAGLNWIKIKPSKVGWCLFGSEEASPWKRLSSNFVIPERVSNQKMASGVDTGWHRLTPSDTALWNARIWCPLGVQRPGASRRQ